MYRFNWGQIHTDSLIAKCRSLSNDKKGSKDEIKSTIVQILKSTGGLSIAKGKWTKSHQEKVGIKLFHEALNHYLKEKYSFTTQSSGFFIDRSNRLQTMDQVDPNTASKESLEKLPVLGTALSAKIVENRRVGGFYETLDELQERTQGLGTEGAAKLEGIININTASLGQLSENFEHNFKSAFALFTLNFGSKSLVGFLDELASFSSLNPHPASQEQVKRNELESATPTSGLELKKVKKTTILTNENYYPFVVEAIKAAKSNIDICLFFLSFGGKTHPNKKLLDLLIEKHSSGVTVRVLLDKDRENDPYGSRIINSKAAAYLKKKGIDVRFDQTDRLLHSKFVILDNKRAVIGSHNWTKGSFLEYDDISLCLESDPLAKDFRTRFERLWEQNPN